MNPVTVNPTFVAPFSRGIFPPQLSFTRDSIATYYDHTGILRIADEGTPRIDHDPVTGECKGLLIEEARTNLLTYSEQFDNAAWTISRSTVAANVATAPDGTTTADKLVEDVSVGGHYTMASLLVVPGTTYCVSIYVKAAERNNVQIINTDFSGGNAVACFNLQDQTYLHDAEFVDVGIHSVGDGWYRILATGVASNTSTLLQVRISNTKTLSVAGYEGDGTSGLYIWGAQLEEGAFPTSYIPTTSSAATRAADVCVLEGSAFSDIWNPTEGTVVAEIYDSGATNPGRIVAFSNVSLTNNSVFLSKTSAGNEITGQIFSAGSLVSNSTQVFSGHATSGLAYKLDDVALSVDGAPPIIDTTATMPTGIDRVYIGSSVSSSYALNGHISHLAYYPKRLSNDILERLTD